MADGELGVLVLQLGSIPRTLLMSTTTNTDDSIDNETVRYNGYDWTAQECPEDGCSNLVPEQLNSGRRVHRCESCREEIRKKREELRERDGDESEQEEITVTDEEVENADIEVDESTLNIKPATTPQEQEKNKQDAIKRRKKQILRERKQEELNGGDAPDAV